MKRIYFAHSMLDYNTDKEKATLNYLRKKFPQFLVICPNTNSDLFPENPDDVMKPYLDYVKDKLTVGIIVMEYQTHIGKGVYSKIETAHDRGKKVNVIRPYFKDSQWHFPNLIKVLPGDLQKLPTRQIYESRVRNKQWGERVDWKRFYAKINVK